MDLCHCSDVHDLQCTYCKLIFAYKSVSEGRGLGKTAHDCSSCSMQYRAEERLIHAFQPVTQGLEIFTECNDLLLREWRVRLMCAWTQRIVTDLSTAWLVLVHHDKAVINDQVTMLLVYAQTASTPPWEMCRWSFVLC